MVSMKDIAERVGISKATVSLVLSGKAGTRVSEAVKQKVIQAAEDLDYHVNDLARSLRTGQTNLISIAVTDISNEFFGKMTFYVQEEAKKRGYVVITANTNESDEDFEETMSTLIRKKVAGIIAVPSQNCSDSLKRVQVQGIPLVQIDRFIDGIDADYVGVDNYKGADDAIKSLLDKGCKKIGMVTLDLDINPINERRRGYQEALESAGKFDAALVRPISYDNQEASIEEAILALAKAGVDAIFFTSRRVFTMSMDFLSSGKSGLSTKTRLMCFDNVLSYMTSSYDVCYVEQPIEQMAKKALELLLEKHEADYKPKQWVFAPKCIMK